MGWVWVALWCVRAGLLASSTLVLVLVLALSYEFGGNSLSSKV